MIIPNCHVWFLHFGQDQIHGVKTFLYIIYITLGQKLSTQFNFHNVIFLLWQICLIYILLSIKFLQIFHWWLIQQKFKYPISLTFNFVNLTVLQQSLSMFILYNIILFYIVLFCLIFCIMLYFFILHHHPEEKSVMIYYFIYLSQYHRRSQIRIQLHRWRFWLTIQ